MKKTIGMLLLAFLVFSAVGVVSAKTLIAGKIYNADYSDTIANATVYVTCADEPVEITSSLGDGSYTVEFDERYCGHGDNVVVDASKDGLVGQKSGTINNEVFSGWDLAIVNVPLVPEFGIFVGALTVVSALVVFFVIRRQ